MARQKADTKKKPAAKAAKATPKAANTVPNVETFRRKFSDLPLPKMLAQIFGLSAFKLETESAAKPKRAAKKPARPAPKRKR